VAPVAVLAMLFTSAGCSKSTMPTETQIYTTAPASVTGPVPDSPGDAILAMAWGMNHLQSKPIADLLPEDFQFLFAATDSSGNAFTGRALTRDDALSSATHLLETGTATQPPASRVNLVLDRTFVAFPDSRPGKMYPWHQEIRTTVTLSIDAGDQDYRILGHARFFLVRGDSASIPPELAAKGFKPDSNRWWIERWEDETVEGAGGRPAVEGTLPTANRTWGSIMALYR
jgi:hypothetical protein